MLSRRGTTELDQRSFLQSFTFILVLGLGNSFVFLCLFFYFFSSPGSWERWA